MAEKQNFVALVAEMRQAQKNYFAERQPYEKQQYLNESKRLEKEVDAAIQAWLDRDKPKQTNLFA